MTGLRAAVTLGLTGRYAVQARDARVGLELWAEDDHVGLHVDDDAGSPAVALAAYRKFLAGDFDILLGPYSSGLVRRVVATVCGAHRLLWNHGGAADDLARPGLVSVLAPASTYLRSLLTVVRDRGAELEAQISAGGAPTCFAEPGLARVDPDDETGRATNAARARAFFAGSAAEAGAPARGDAGEQCRGEGGRRRSSGEVAGR